MKLRRDAGRWVRLRGGVAVLPLAIALSAACDDGDTNKKPGANQDAGSDGSVTTGGSAGSAGNSAAGTGATGATGATGGSGGSGGTSGGSGGAQDAGLDADAGADAGPLLPSALFSVAPGAIGATGSAVAAQTSPESQIYHAENPGLPPSVGGNALAVTNTQIGLVDQDDLDAIAVLRAVPTQPVYYFAVGEATYIRPSTQLERAAASAPPQGDVFFSDGVGSHMNVNEGGEDYGYNALFYAHQSLGLEVSGASVPVADALNALELDVPATTSAVYFSVSAAAVGVAGSAVASTPADERGCTIYRSGLDGTNQVAYSCDALGLVPADEVDALVVLGTAGNVSKLLFSVSGSSMGKLTSAVRQEVDLGEVPGDIFASDGLGGNTLEVDEVALGLENDNDLTALSFRDQPRPPRFTPTGSCDLSPSPISDPQYEYLSSVVPISGTLALVTISSSGSGQGSVYDMATCARVTPPPTWDGLPPGTLFTQRLPGWSAATPLSNLRLWSAQVGTGSLRLTAYDPMSGLEIESWVGQASMYSVQLAQYIHATNQILVLGEINQAFLMDAPAVGGGTGALPNFQVLPVPRPCAGFVNVYGYDETAGSLELFDDRDYDEMHDRGCSLDSQFYFKGPAWQWDRGSMGQADFGGLVLDQSLYMFHGDLSAAVTVERFDP